LRLGRWVSADAAAVFAAALDFGSRNTFAAADAARLLVTSGLLATVHYLFDLTIRPIRPKKNYVFVGSCGKKYMLFGGPALPTIP